MDGSVSFGWAFENLQQVAGQSPNLQQVAGQSPNLQQVAGQSPNCEQQLPQAPCDPAVRATPA